MPEDVIYIAVQVKALGFLERYTDRKTLIEHVPVGCTVADIIRRTVDRLGCDFGNTIFDRHGTLNGGIEVVLNREHISAYKLSETRIWEDSELILVPLIAGGAKQVTGFSRTRRSRCLNTGIPEGC